MKTSKTLTNKSQDDPDSPIKLESPNFIDGQQWEFRQQKLIPQSNLGSTISYQECSDGEMKRLASIHRRNSYSTGDKEKDQTINRYQYLMKQFQWLEQFIPETILDQILQLMAYSKTGKKLVKDLEGMNLRDLALILAFWQLDVYTTGSYIVEEVLQEINDYLKSFSNGFCLRGHVTVKDIQLAEDLILHDLYTLELNQSIKTRTFRFFPTEALQYYRAIYHTFKANIPQEFTNKIEKARKIKPELVIPSSVYIWVVRQDILKKILPFLASRAGVDSISIKRLHSLVDNFWTKVFHQKAVGDLPTIGYLILETWSEHNSPNNTINIASMHSPDKYKTRIKSYRYRFKKLLTEIVTSELKTDIGDISIDGSLLIRNLIIKKHPAEIKLMIVAIQKWLDRFESKGGQKLLQRSSQLLQRYNENNIIIISLKKHLELLKQENYHEWCYNQYIRFQTKINELRTDAYQIFHEILSPGTDSKINIEDLFTLEELEIPHLRAQLPQLINPFQSFSSKKAYRIIEEEFMIQSDKELIRYNEFVQMLSQKLSIKINEVLEDHIVSNPLNRKATDSFIIE